MPIVKIDKKGYEKFSGNMGAVKFKDGVSTENISEAEALRLGSFLPIIDVESEDQQGASAVIQASKGLTSADVGHEQALSQGGDAEESETSGSKSKESEDSQDSTEEVDLDELSYDFTEDSLAEICDKDGIKGLREFAGPYGVVGKSIVDIQSGLMAKKEMVLSRRGEG